MNRFIFYDDNLKPYAILLETAADGTDYLRTEDGQEVQRIDRGEYEIICKSGAIRVWSDDPIGP